MEKKISKAFTFMFKDSDWIYKLFILSALAFPSFYLAFEGENLKQYLTKSIEDPYQLAGFFILLLVLTTICTFFFEGYCCKCTNIIMNAGKSSNEKDLLPKWEEDFLGYFRIGFNFSVGVSFIGLAVAIGSILIVPLLFFGVAYIALKTLFCVDFKIKSFFAWRTASDLMRKNLGHYLLVVFCSLLIYVAFGAISYLCSKKFDLVFVGAFVQAYIYLALAYLRGTLLNLRP